MDEVIFRAFHGRTTRAEDELLQSWREEQSCNERRYAELHRILSDTLTAASPSVAQQQPPEELFARSSMIGRRPAAPRKNGARRRLGAPQVGAALAAGIGILLVGIGIRGSGSDNGLLGTGEVVTGAAETTTIGLADGTVVRLAPSSRLRVTGDAGTREVWLNGRAYFAVTKRQGVPFRVRTHAGEAVVLGTRFDLEARNDNLEVLVVEGAVNVAAGGGSLNVEASQSASATRARAPVVIEVDESYVREELSWVGDFLVFKDAPLSRVARELTAHFGVPVEVLDSTFARQTVRGMFVEQSLDSVLSQICKAVSGHCSIGPTGVTISP